MIKELKSKKAIGVDGIPSRLLKDGAGSLASPWLLHCLSFLI